MFNGLKICFLVLFVLISWNLAWAFMDGEPDFIVDIDGVLVFPDFEKIYPGQSIQINYSLEIPDLSPLLRESLKKGYEKIKARMVNPPFSGEIYLPAKGVSSFLMELSKLGRVSYFSAGFSVRNYYLLNLIELEDGRTALDLARNVDGSYRVYSYEDTFRDQFFKTYKKLIQSSHTESSPGVKVANLEQSLLIDDNPANAISSQVLNLLNPFAHVPCSSWIDAYFYFFRRFQMYLESDHLSITLQRIRKAIEMASNSHLNLVEAVAQVGILTEQPFVGDQETDSEPNSDAEVPSTQVKELENGKRVRIVHAGGKKRAQARD